MTVWQLENMIHMKTKPNAKRADVEEVNHYDSMTTIKYATHMKTKPNAKLAAVE